MAKATGEAFPVAFVSDAIGFAVAVPLDDAPKAVELNDKVATAALGLATVLPVMRNTR